MINTNGNTFFDNNEKNYYRFSKKELLEQKRELLFYIINELTQFNLSSIEESVKEIKELTGIDISLEEATQLCRLAHLTEKCEEQEEIRLK